MSNPIAFEWTGEAMVPIRAHLKRADAQFVIGMSYILDTYEARSMAMHKGYFARIREAWTNLPDDIADAYPSPESLRKRALIKCGYAKLTEVLAASSREAAKMAEAMTAADEFALVVIEDRALRIWRAQSQSVKAMGGKAFKESIDRVEHWIAALIGARVEDYRRAA
jgi:hypothetical protein